MNAITEKAHYPASNTTPPAPNSLTIEHFSLSSTPARHEFSDDNYDGRWINHYDEEWSAFVEEHSMRKCWTAESELEPEPLPRVWNLPHG